MLLKGHIFIIFFFFYILPQILLITIFVTEICFYHQLNFFYKCSPLYLIPVLFKVFFLNALFDYAVQNKLTPFISMQNHYSLIYREEEREMYPTLKVRKPWSPRVIKFVQLHTDVRCRFYSLVAPW